jgi:hypothetical protein
LEITQLNQKSDAIHQACEQFSGVLRRQAEQIENLNQSLKSLQKEQRQLEDVASQLLGPLERTAASSDATDALSPSNILACVRRLAAATYGEQILEVLAGEAARMNLRAAVFDVRGRAAWGASASGFGPGFSGNSFRTLVVPLNHDGPFRRVFEAAEAVEARPADFEKDLNVLAKLGPTSDARIVLVPVRSADSVVAILYADIGAKRNSTLIDSLKVLAEFAGGQIDRLLVVSGGLSAIETVSGIAEAANATEQADGDEARTSLPDASASPEIPVAMMSAAVPTEPTGPPAQAEQAFAPSPAITPPAEEPPSAAVAANATHSSEEEEKIHRDARRFSKLLVSEIELYNKSTVEEGRRNSDLYQRLKKDIDRSRETYEKRFAHTVASQFDYFHEELVKTLAENDPTLLGSGYPGSSV